MNDEIPPPSALPQLDKMKLDRVALGTPKSANPFAPRGTTGSPIVPPPSTGVPLPVPPHPSTLPPPMAFPKPGATPTSSVVRPKDVSEIMGRSQKSPSPAKSSPPPPAAAPVLPAKESSPSTQQVKKIVPIDVSPLQQIAAPPAAISPSKIGTLSPIGTTPSNPPPQIEASSVEQTKNEAKTAPLQAQQSHQATVVKQQNQQQDGEGMFDWFTKQVHENPFFSMVAEKAKVGMETVLTTLDPGMKDFLAGDGIIEAYVGTEDPMISSAVRQGFERVFHSAVIRGVPVPAADASAALMSDSIDSSTKSCVSQILRLSASRLASPSSPFVVFQPSILHIEHISFYSLRLMLRWKGIDLFALSQPVEISEDLWAQLQRFKTTDGFSVTLEQLHKQMGSAPLLPFHESEPLILASALLAAKLKEILTKQAEAVKETTGK